LEKNKFEDYRKTSGMKPGPA